MESMTKKLNTFTSLVLKDASKKREEILEMVEREHDEKLTERENEFLQKAYEEIQQAVSDARKHSNELVLKEELEAKKQLLLCRQKIISEVMDEAQKRLMEFASSEAYEAWLIDKTKKSLAEVGEGSKTVYIAPNDLRYKDILLQLGNITIEEDDTVFGGVKVYNSDKRIAVDYSFNEMLSEEKRKFLQSSGLSIN